MQAARHTDDVIPYLWAEEVVASECTDDVIEPSMSADVATEVTLALSTGSGCRNGRNSSSSSSANGGHTNTLPSAEYTWNTLHTIRIYHMGYTVHSTHSWNAHPAVCTTRDIQHKYCRE